MKKLFTYCLFALAMITSAGAMADEITYQGPVDYDLDGKFDNTGGC